jgi:hypothetical protein
LISVTLLNCGNGRSAWRVTRSDQAIGTWFSRKVVRGQWRLMLPM